MTLGLGDPLDRGTALKDTEHVLLKKHGKFALRVPRGLSGFLILGDRGPLIPGTQGDMIFDTCGKCEYKAGMWVRKNSPLTPLLMYLRTVGRKMRII
jgi:hypothetical protein